MVMVTITITIGGGCAGPGGERAGAPSTAVGGGGAGASANRERLARDEDVLLRRLAAVDARLARRAGVTANEADLQKNALGAILHEDTGARVVDGGLDVFSFDARARGIQAARGDVDGWTYALEGDAALERDLLRRLLAEEEARVKEESDLPRAASTLVRGMVESWSPPATPQAMAERDAWVARRLDDLRGSLKDGALTTFEANELDDELDALEHATSSGFPASSAALTKLRLAAGDVKPAKEPRGRADLARAGATVHLGLSVAPETFAELERVEHTLREAIKKATASMAEADVGATEQAAVAEVLVEGRCGEAVASRVRAMVPPPERAAACGAVHVAAEAHDAASRLRALMALHADVVVALWAKAIHFGPDAPYHAARQWRPVMTLSEEREVRLLRVAAVRPVAAIGAGWAVAMLATGPRGVDGIADRAEAWSGFGDAPLDVVATHLAGAR